MNTLQVEYLLTGEHVGEQCSVVKERRVRKVWLDRMLWEEDQSSQTSYKASSDQVVVLMYDLKLDTLLGRFARL
ncbi:uncharacterized protein PHALS_09094 [Plasmopara halstedii]|uniref:Uncharacterized protein n=1 Tax=Plasmopara halstedii TaxID=4781 RepID=A0A0P1ADN1_PLAHL|nr:uncharacterized protein PHALS_09094 [Plasmopara halstedii]CEG39029.1 hypothetical protein PHALS_09094 [Plasmopara halstedii]|eukprot:XP_024575398.1 hypothetical protein PHALS_09094 [Plasmopara halstedii]